MSIWRQLSIVLFASCGAAGLAGSAAAQPPREPSTRFLERAVREAGDERRVEFQRTLRPLEKLLREQRAALERDDMEAASSKAMEAARTLQATGPLDRKLQADWKAAVSDQYEKVIKTGTPELADQARISLSRFQYEAGDLSKAVQLLETVDVKRLPDNARSTHQLNKAEIYQKLKQPERAFELYFQAAVEPTKPLGSAAEAAFDLLKGMDAMPADDQRALEMARRMQQTGHHKLVETKVLSLLESPWSQHATAQQLVGVVLESCARQGVDPEYLQERLLGPLAQAAEGKQGRFASVVAELRQASGNSLRLTNDEDSLKKSFPVLSQEELRGSFSKHLANLGKHHYRRLDGEPDEARLSLAANANAWLLDPDDLEAAVFAFATLAKKGGELDPEFQIQRRLEERLLAGQAIGEDDATAWKNRLAIDYLLGSRMASAGRWEARGEQRGAVDYLERAAELERKLVAAGGRRSPDVHRLLARALMHMGDRDRAVAEAAQAARGFAANGDRGRAELAELLAHSLDDRFPTPLLDKSQERLRARMQRQETPLLFPNALAATPDGMLFCADGRAGAVYAIDLGVPIVPADDRRGAATVKDLDQKIADALEIRRVFVTQIVPGPGGQLIASVAHIGRDREPSGELVSIDLQPPGNARIRRLEIHEYPSARIYRWQPPAEQQPGKQLTAMHLLRGHLLFGWAHPTQQRAGRTSRARGFAQLELVSLGSSRPHAGAVLTAGAGRGQPLGPLVNLVPWTHEGQTYLLAGDGRQPITSTGLWDVMEPDTTVQGIPLEGLSNEIRHLFPLADPEARSSVLLAISSKTLDVYRDVDPATGQLEKSRPSKSIPELAGGRVVRVVPWTADGLLSLVLHRREMAESSVDLKLLRWR